MRFFLFAILLQFCSDLASQNDVLLSCANGSVFNVWIKDSAINQRPQANVHLKGLKTDTVKITIQFENKVRASETLFLLDKGKKTSNTEFNYVIESKNERTKFSFAGIQPATRLPDPLVPKKPVVDTTSKYRNNVLGHYVELKDALPVFFNNLPKKGTCSQPMPDSYINYFMILVSKAHTDDDIFDLAENTTRSNCFSVAQFNRILLHIHFELEKLKLIKMSYLHITDKNNKKRLDSTFRLESSKTELSNFLKTSDDLQTSVDAGCKVAAADGDVNKLTEKLTAYTSDVEKLMILKKIYSDLCYSVIQVRKVLSLFVHDREKTDAAKLLYFNCTEKDKFMNISDLFSYNQSVSDLQGFLEKQKN